MIMMIISNTCMILAILYICMILVILLLVILMAYIISLSNYVFIAF